MALTDLIPEVAEVQWPLRFANDRPLPSSGQDSVIVILDMTANKRYFVDPPTRKVIDANTLEFVGYRRDHVVIQDSRTEIDPDPLAGVTIRYEEIPSQEI